MWPVLKWNVNSPIGWLAHSNPLELFNTVKDFKLFRKMFNLKRCRTYFLYLRRTSTLLVYEKGKLWVLVLENEGLLKPKWELTFSIAHAKYFSTRHDNFPFQKRLTFSYPLDIVKLTTISLSIRAVANWAVLIEHSLSNLQFSSTLFGCY